MGVPRMFLGEVESKGVSTPRILRTGIEKVQSRGDLGKSFQEAPWMLSHPKGRVFSAPTPPHWVLSAPQTLCSNWTALGFNSWSRVQPGSLRVEGLRTASRERLQGESAASPVLGDTVTSFPPVPRRAPRHSHSHLLSICFLSQGSVSRAPEHQRPSCLMLRSPVPLCDLCSVGLEKMDIPVFVCLF